MESRAQCYFLVLISSDVSAFSIAVSMACFPLFAVVTYLMIPAATMSCARCRGHLYLCKHLFPRSLPSCGCRTSAAFLALMFSVSVLVVCRLTRALFSANLKTWCRRENLCGQVLILSVQLCCWRTCSPLVLAS